jgi:hypothetical protein
MLVKEESNRSMDLSADPGHTLIKNIQN